MFLYTMLGLLMLLPALLKSSTACPLTLQPPELELEFGEAGSVNCTAEINGHHGIYWTYGNEKQREVPDSLTMLQIPSSDWNKTAKCTIKLNATYDCSIDLGIKVYKRPTDIIVQSNGSAVKGKQIELMCTIFNVDGAQKLTVKWYINNTLVKSVSASNTTFDMSSSLKYNVSGEDHGVTFTCEASALGPSGRFLVINDTWKLSVQYAPKFEKKTHNIQVNKSGEVSLHCEATGNPPPQYKWIKDNVTIANNTNHLNLEVNETVVLNCEASNDLGSTVKTFTVTLIKTPAAPEAPESSDCPLVLSPKELQVEFGEKASANCSTTLTDAEGLGWEATAGGIGLRNVTHLEWKLPKMEWETTAKCFISRNDGSQCEKALDFTIWKSADEVKVSPIGNSSLVEDKPQQLKCEIFNFAPARSLQVKWYQDGTLIHTDRERFTGSNATLTTETSILDLMPKKEHDRANFTCEAELLLGHGQKSKVVSKPYTANVQYKPSILECPKKYAGQEGYLLLKSVLCKASGNPEPDIYWYYNNKPVNSTEALTRRDSGTYTAKFANIIGSTSTTVDIITEYGPSLSCRDQYNVTENDNAGSECEAEGKPKPNIFWFKDGINFTLPKMWKRRDIGQYTIVASNEYGQVNHTLRINVWHIPRFSEESITTEFDLGENLTLECAADGNPSPALVWKKYPPAANVKFHTRGRYSYVHVTEATSSNAGLYSCTATNDVGSVSKNITLMMRGEQRALHNIIFISVALVIILLIFVAVLIYRNYRKKSGHYDVIPDSVPLTNRT